jgi:hypothetical protein
MEIGIGWGEYARVKSIDAAANWLTVQLQDKMSALTILDGGRVSPCSERKRVAFPKPTASNSLRLPTTVKVANRELGSIEYLARVARDCIAVVEMHMCVQILLTGLD